MLLNTTLINDTILVSTNKNININNKNLGNFNRAIKCLYTKNYLRTQEHFIYKIFFTVILIFRSLKKY